jgi:hypothetical protein
MAIQQNFPDEGPSLNLNFAGSRTLDPRITFTRTSSATHMGPDGLIKIAAANSPRFDHSYNSATGEIESLGLLIEEARTNFALQSQSLDAGDSGSSTGWYGVVRSSISANIALSPDGTLTADKIIANTENNSHNLANRTQNNTIICANPCTVSVFLKASGETKAWLFITEASTYARTSLTYLDLTGSGSSTTPINANGAGSSSSSITAYPNGWYRCILTTTLGGTDSRVEVRIGPSQSMSTNIYAGNDLDGILAWGLQIEQGSFPTSYIPTTASTVTRTADNASMTGTNFSSWYNPNEGSIFSIASTIDPSSVFPTLASFNDGTTQNRIQIGRTNGNNAANRCFIEKDSVNQATIIFGSTSQNQLAKLSLGWKQNSVIGTMNNLQSAEDTNALIPTVSRLQLGATTGLTPSFSFLLNGHISQLTYYPTRLPNNILQNLTR